MCLPTEISTNIGLFTNKIAGRYDDFRKKRDVSGGEGKGEGEGRRRRRDVGFLPIYPPRAKRDTVKVDFEISGRRSVVSTHVCPAVFEWCVGVSSARHFVICIARRFSDISYFSCVVCIHNSHSPKLNLAIQ